MFRVQKALLNMFWEYSPSSMNLASDWLKAKSATAKHSVDEEEIKIKMDVVSILHSLQRELTYLMTYGRHSLVSRIHNDIVLS